MINNTIKELPDLERPYEKFINCGVEALSDAELLAIIIKSGSRELSSVELARSLLVHKNGNLLNLYDYSFEDLIKFSGIGKVKAIQLKAIAELAVRISKTQKKHDLNMNNSKSVAGYYMEQLRHLSKEHLVCAFFDGKCNFIGDEILSVGSVNYAFVSPKDIFTAALNIGAVSFVILHNHPSGDPSPSQDDICVTERIRECSRLLDIEFLDHIIIGDNCYYSFCDKEVWKLKEREE